MQLSRFLNAAADALDSIPPTRLAAAISAGVAFLLSLLLLRDTLAGAAAGTQSLATGIGALIAAFLSWQLAAYVMRLLAQRAGWPDMARARQWLIVAVVALFAAAVVVAIMVLVS